MPATWIVHRDARLRGPVARLAGAEPDALLGGPADASFERAASPDVVVLAVVGDFEPELEFAHRHGARHPDATWILLAEGADTAEVRRLFDVLPARVLEFPAEAPALRSHVRGARVRRRAQALSERRTRDAVAARFARWFADLELPAVLRALDPKLCEVPVLVRGEPGTGRGLLAAYVHAFGGAQGGHFARIACEGLDLAGLAAEIACAAAEESAARGLTLCLEDVERLPLPAQRRLRGWIESGLPHGVRAAAPRVRWIATCSESGPLDPAESLDLGLAQVLAALEVRIPPLRERAGAIERLATATASAWCAARGEAPRRFAPDAAAELAVHPWPGNLRELESVVARTLAGGAGDPIRAGDLRFEGAPEPLVIAEPAVEAEETEEPESMAEAELEPPAAFAAARAASATAAPAAAGEPPPLALAEGPLRKLVGAISHEVRNPLVAIRTFAQLLPEHFDDPEFRGRFAALVGDDVRRIERAVELLARFAAFGAPERKPVDLATLLDDLLEDHREDVQTRRLVVLRELDREHPSVQGDAAQLRFAFTALLAKALELVPERGDVYLASRHHPTGLRGAPAARVLLRFQNPEEGVPTLGVEGVSLAETALEVVLADAIVRAHGGSFVASAADSRETVILVDLPA
jgi:DNA-binding NtrC family response regulator